MKKIRSFIAIATLAFLPSFAMAWGVTGHRVVGQIADYYLSAKARAAVKKILGTEDLAIASNWGDFIKSDPAYDHVDPWHYVNLSPGLTKDALFNYLSTETAPNIYNKTVEMIALLKNPKSTVSEKKMAMKMIIHLIGDMNQPMHTARKEDLGANKIQVSWFNQPTNLHTLWDSKIIDFQQLSYTEYAKAINHPSAIQLLNWKKSTLKDAIYESYEICNSVYASAKEGDKLSYKYNFDFIEILNKQLLKGGIRLAQVLNNIYG